MIDAKSILSFDTVFKKSVLRLVPELEGKQFEVRFQKGLICPKCGKSDGQAGGALFYRLDNKSEWIQAGETFTCSVCRDAEAFNQYMETSLKEQKSEISNRLENEYFLIPGNLKNAGFKNYEETNKVTAAAKKKAIEYAKSYLAEESERYNLLVTGSPGTGKSHLCAAIARTIKEKGSTVGFLTTGQLLSKIKATYNRGAVKTEEEVLQDIKKLDCLILDDLGSEALGGNEDWRKGIIFQIVESRSGKPTIYTSNLTEDNLYKAVGQRVNSRLYDNTKFIDLFTDDYRKRLRIN